MSLPPTRPKPSRETPARSVGAVTNRDGAGHDQEAHTGPPSCARAHLPRANLPPRRLPPPQPGGKDGCKPRVDRLAAPGSRLGDGARLADGTSASPKAIALGTRCGPTGTDGGHAPLTLP